MARVMRTLLIIVPLCLMLATSASAAQPGQEPGAGCGSTSSAVNQYCEDIPSATGGSAMPTGTAGPPAPTLGTALPQSAARAYQRLPATTRKRARKLLSLPAPAPAVPVSASFTADRSAWSLPTGLILAMLAIVAACSAAAVARRNRSRGGE